MTLPTVLTAHSLTRQFGDFVAVADVSFSLGAGEVLGLLGPNGAGKTTTMQMLLGVLLPSSGTVSYFGLDLWRHRSAVLNRINFCSAYTTLPFNLKVRDAFSYMPHLYSVANPRDRVREVFDLLDLHEHWHKEIGKLSSGELTRLNLAKALLNHPEVLLLDEPTASLDPVSAKLVRDLIVRLQREWGLSVLLTSHNMRDIEFLCSRVIFINHGKIVAEGPPRELAARLDRYSVAFHVPEAEISLVSERLRARGLTATIEGTEVRSILTEREVQRLVPGLTGVQFSGLSIERADMEDYFLSHLGGG